MSEPSYDELKARLADLEKQVETKKRSGTMEFKVSRRRSQRLWPRSLPSHTLLRTMDAPA